VRRIFRVDCGVSDARQDFAGEQDQTTKRDQQRQDVQPRQPCPPGRYADPQTTDDDDSFGPEESEKTEAAIVLVGPESERYSDSANQNQARGNADRGRALTRAFLRPLFFFA